MYCLFNSLMVDYVIDTLDLSYNVVTILQCSGEQRVKSEGRDKLQA